MQSGRPGAPVGGAPSPSASSPSSSSPGIHHHHQQQLLAFAQQHLRKHEGEDSLLAYQASGIHGVSGGTNFPSSSGVSSLPQPPRRSGDVPHHLGVLQSREDGQNKGPSDEQHNFPNPVQQAYIQFALQAAQKKSLGTQLIQQNRIQMGGPPSREQDMHLHNLKMQELMSLQAANQAQLSAFKRPADNLVNSERQTEQARTIADQQNDPKLPQASSGQLSSGTNMRPGQAVQLPLSMPNTTNPQLQMTQLQAMQAWAQEHNVDLSHPANASILAQFMPMLRSARVSAMQRTSEASSTSPQQSSLPHVMSSPACSENSAHSNSASDRPPSKVQQTLASGSVLNGPNNPVVSGSGLPTHLIASRRGNQNESVSRSPNPSNGVPGMLSSRASSQGMDIGNARSTGPGLEAQQAFYMKSIQQPNRAISQSSSASSEPLGIPSSSHGGLSQLPLQRMGFTKEQLHVLKAQILAFRHIKRGVRELPDEVILGITPPPLESQLQQISPSLGTTNPERVVVKNIDDHAKLAETEEKASQIAASSAGHSLPKEEGFTGDNRFALPVNMQGAAAPIKQKDMMPPGKTEQTSSLVKAEETERGSQPSKADYNVDKEKIHPVQSASTETTQIKKLTPATTGQKDNSKKKYNGPLFDFPCFTRKPDPSASTAANNGRSFALAYDVKDLMFEEGILVLGKKRAENLKKLSGLLSVNLERKRIRPDLVMRLQIEEKKLRLFDLQARLRDEVDQEQQEIMAMTDRPYRKFVRQCERQRQELLRQVQQLQKASREKQLKSIFQWRKKLLESHWAIRDARTARNRGVAKYHERMLREFSKRKDDDRNKRMEALKNNDVDRYREMLLEQQTNVPADAAQRYSVLSSFLSQTEEYLYKLGGKVTAAKNNQEVQEAANAAAAAARAQGLSEEEVRAAAACAGEEVMIRNRFSEMNAPKDSSSVNKYYNLAHAVNERVVRQPSMLRTGTLRDYQLVGLQWMLSLYNNKLNGILADEMGLGKTVQVMALIAYLMEFKGNYGPHLIIVPNAVLVNWKSELLNWLPSVSCIFYVGGKDQRSKLFSHEVCAMKFNVLVTTYEFVMYDRSKLSKIDWKYIIIDEAQRMKDRESVLARDLDRYRCQRRLLLTGTPLQNDLKELWSLLNLLLPEVFDNRKAFHDWFSKPFQKDVPTHSEEEDDWLETEKKVIIIHRLHQILEPFMLRRRVEDVEGSLPPKVSIVLRCRMSAMQSAIYDWIKSTGTIRVDPEDERRRLERNPLYQVKVYKNLNNKCMELRKVCNHPLLNYPYYNDYSKEFIVRSCGKLWVLDRILIKLQRAGHRVLLFSTMTKLLDLVEEYLQWRRLVYRRIDGTTSLEDRESAIVDFNSPDSDCFIFLLSIRAAGRGLNLQTADTVVIYDPDPNPQNEEQAVARAHRIGQQREVKVIYMEAVVDKISSYQKEDDLRNGGTGDLDDDLVGKDRYIGSIESLIRNNIQQYKIDMADEVINAGRFDQRTTHEERRMTLETLLHDEERYQETVHDVPSMQEVNRMIARSEEEVELFDQMDEEFDWVEEMINFDQVPTWLRAGSREVNATVSSLSKKPSKNVLTSNIDLESSELMSGLSQIDRRRGRPKGPSNGKYRELDDCDFEESDASSEERNVYSLHEEDGEIGEFEDEDTNGVAEAPESNKEQDEEEGLVGGHGGFEFPQVVEDRINIGLGEEGGSSGSSSGSRRLMQPLTMSPQKFGSLSALDSRPGPGLGSRRAQDDLEEGEIAVSGDSHMDIQQSASWTHERDDNEDEQVLQPKIKRKRSMRIRPRHAAERTEEKGNIEKMFHHNTHQSFFHGESKYNAQLRKGPEHDAYCDPISDMRDVNTSTVIFKGNMPSKKAVQISSSKSGKLACISGSVENAAEMSRARWNGNAAYSGGRGSSSPKMSDSMQRKCKNVLSKFQRKIDKEGHQIAPVFLDFWKRNLNSSCAGPVMTGDVLDLRRIEQRIDTFMYEGVPEFIADVQLMLRNVVQHCNNSFEVRFEARKLNDLFFDIMKIAFPDTDFREARNAVSSASAGPAAAPSPRHALTGQSKLQKLGRELELEKASMPVDEEAATRKVRRGSGPNSGNGSNLPLLAHPGDLVICKKKRKDRDKPAVNVMQRLGPASPSTPSRLGPLSPASSGRIGPTSPPASARSSRAMGYKDTVSWPHQPTPQQQQSHSGGGGSPGISDVQWARPVKKLRTDTGKRRPSHM